MLLVHLACQVLLVPLAIQDNLDLQDHQVQLDHLALKDQEEIQVRQDHLVKMVNQDHWVQMDLLVLQDRTESPVSQEFPDNEVVPVELVLPDSQGQQDLQEVGVSQGLKVLMDQMAIVDK